MATQHETALKDLVIAAREGDRDAFAEITRRFTDYAHSKCYSVLRDHQLAEDATQEAFAEAFLNLDKLREPAAFPGWFKRIIIKRIDRLIRGKKLPMTSLETAYETPSTEPAPEEGLDGETTSETMHGAIDFLPEHEREVARLYYFEGLSQKEIADKFDVPVTTIKKRLYSSRQRLKKDLVDLRPLDDAAETSGDDLPLKTQLFAAARHGFVRKVDRLLQLHPSLIEARDDDGLSIQLYAAHAAHHSGNMAVVNLLLAHGADIDVHVASALGMRAQLDAFVRRLPESATERGSWLRAPIHWAASGGHARLIEWLIEHGADPNAQDAFGCTPLHLAAELGRNSATGILLESGADVNAALKNGKTVMHLAAQGRDPRVIKHLLSHGAELDIFSASTLGLTGIVTELVQTDPECVNDRLPFGATPLHMAAEHGQYGIADLLLKNGAKTDLNAAAEMGRTDDVDRLLADDPGTVNQKGGSFGYTPLHSATSKGYRDLARLLIVRGADVNATDEMYDKTPMGEALYYGNEAMARLLHRHGGHS